MFRNCFAIELDFLSLIDKNIRKQFHCKTMLDIGKMLNQGHLEIQASTVIVAKLFIIPIILSYSGFKQNNTKNYENFLSSYCKNPYQRFKTVIFTNIPIRFITHHYDSHHMFNSLKYNKFYLEYIQHKGFNQSPCEIYKNGFLNRYTNYSIRIYFIGKFKHIIFIFPYHIRF